MSLICTYVCSVLLRLEKQGRQEAGAVLSPGEDGPVWPERAEEWLGENQTLSARWVGCAELPRTLATELCLYLALTSVLGNLTTSALLQVQVWMYMGQMEDHLKQNHQKHDITLPVTYS